MPTKDKKKPTWVWIYGDEMPEVWEHFGFPYPDPDDRIKLKVIKYESKVLSSQKWKNVVTPCNFIWTLDLLYIGKCEPKQNARE